MPWDSVPGMTLPFRSVMLLNGIPASSDRNVPNRSLNSLLSG